MTDAPTLAEWLLERIAEDEAAARAATPGPWRHFGGQRSHDIVAAATLEHVAAAAEVFNERQWVPLDRADAAHIARHDPARVLARCEADRRIVEDAKRAEWIETQGHVTDWSQGELSAYRSILRALASVYADAPGWREEWR